MTPISYSIALLIGVLLVGGGVAMFSIAAALVVIGVLVLVLTIFNVMFIVKR